MNDLLTMWVAVLTLVVGLLIFALRFALPASKLMSALPPVDPAPSRSRGIRGTPTYDDPPLPPRRSAAFRADGCTHDHHAARDITFPAEEEAAMRDVLAAYNALPRRARRALRVAIIYHKEEP